MRALRYLAGVDRRQLSKANSVGSEIWIGEQLRSQGLGGAASRILKRLQDDGLVVWMSNDSDWGWKITSSGRTAEVRGRE